MLKFKYRKKLFELELEIDLMEVPPTLTFGKLNYNKTQSVRVSSTPLLCASLFILLSCTGKTTVNVPVSDTCTYWGLLISYFIFDATITIICYIGSIA